MAEWSKALASGASPKGRGFEPHSSHIYWGAGLLPLSADPRCTHVGTAIGEHAKTVTAAAQGRDVRARRENAPWEARTPDLEVNSLTL